MIFKDRKSCDEWPQNNESFAEFMVRKDKEKADSSKVGIIVVFLFLAPFLVSLIVAVLDKAAK